MKGCGRDGCDSGCGRDGCGMGGSNDCRRCTYPEAVRGYCEACTEYLCGVVEENLAQYAGYTEAEWRDYADEPGGVEIPEKV